MPTEKIMGSSYDTQESIKRKFESMNKSRKVTSIKTGNSLRGLNGTVIAKSFQVTYKNRRSK